MVYREPGTDYSRSKNNFNFSGFKGHIGRCDYLDLFYYHNLSGLKVINHDFKKALKDIIIVWKMNAHFVRYFVGKITSSVFTYHPEIPPMVICCTAGLSAKSMVISCSTRFLEPGVSIIS